MIIITGASNGIGQFLFDLYNRNGTDVFGIYNSTPQNSNSFIKLDITNEFYVKEFYERKASVLKEITLINCAGINANGMANKFELDVFRKVIEVNVMGTFLMIKYALNLMRIEEYGRIINFSSVVPQTGVPGTIAYSSSKSALWGLTKTVAKENALKNITCNCLNLGYFDIGMINQVPEKARDFIISSIPMKKFGDPINIFNAIEFIRSSDYITGTTIDINGGLY